VNTVGIIDSDYYGNEKNEGHIMAKIANDNLMKPVTLEAGTAICQGVFSRYLLTEDDRTLSRERTGGFGSTDTQEPLIAEPGEGEDAREENVQKTLVPLRDIVIPRVFAGSLPTSSKISNCYKHYRRYGTLNRDIVLDTNNKLCDGHVAFLIARMVGMREVEVLYSDPGISNSVETESNCENKPTE